MEEQERQQRDDFLTQTTERIDALVQKMGEVSLKLRNLSRACEGERQGDEIRVSSLMSVNFPPIFKTFSNLVGRLDMLEQWICGTTPQVETPSAPPPDDTREPTIGELEASLQKAIDAEEYERASEIRSQLEAKKRAMEEDN